MSNDTSTGTRATYTKLRDGSWGVRVIGSAREGDTVSVTTKAGASKTETVKSVLWSGPDRASGQVITLCAVAQRSEGGGRNPRVCVSCGHQATGQYGDVIYRSGECRDCFEERKMGY